MATPLIQDAKNAGLLPIPADKKELNKLIDNPKNPITKEKVELGKKLFFDTRLSKSGLISCNTCHNLATGGVDGVSAAIGHKWTANPHHLNSPTVYNAVFFSSQFWDGRSPDVENQAQGPIQAAPEMAATPEHIVAVVTSMPAYVKEFKKAYGDKKITFELVADTIATFERTLVTPAPYDKFLAGNEKALSKTQQRGLKTFIDKGCTTCHTGIALGGEMQMFGVVAPYKYAHIGDFKGNKDGMVKVPTLRNITETAPYFHNGAVATLKEAIQEMGRIQLGVEITDKEAADIQAFFKSLDGKKPAITYPQLPACTDTTPKPDMN
ncbi:cytochrome-c peroxidase [bacterium]|nr:cytochrome-c peroxidase [bacterium]MBU1884085.1 cytochrome-c peroxidase [bacterium]